MQHIESKMNECITKSDRKHKVKGTHKFESASNKNNKAYFFFLSFSELIESIGIQKANK